MVAEFMHSDKLTAMLQYAQKAKLRPLGIRADLSPLTTVLKDLGFAKQRFDSSVDPAGKLALLLLPVATVLAIVASDGRNAKPRRDYAERALRFLNTKFATALGISADWGTIWIVLLRLFDVDDHDIAASRDQVEAHTELLTALFLDGGVFDTRTWGAPLAASVAFPLAPAVVHCMGEVGLSGQFITEHVRRQVARRCEFNVAGNPVALWGPLQDAEKKELGERLQNATTVGIDRLTVELNGLSDLRRHMSCFHIPRLQKVFGPAGQSDHTGPPNLRRSFRELWQMIGLPPTTLDAATAEYERLATFFVRETLPGSRFYGMTNRKVWSLCLDAKFMERLDRGRPAPYQHVFPVIRFYNSILDGTVIVERDFALVRAFVLATKGNGGIALLEDFLTVRCSRHRLDEIATVEGSRQDELGRLGLACARLWRQVFGARLGIGRSITKSDPIFKGRRSSMVGYTRVKKGVLKAAGHVAEGINVVRVARHAIGSLKPGTPSNKFWNARLPAKFRANFTHHAFSIGLKFPDVTSPLEWLY